MSSREFRRVESCDFLGHHHADAVAEFFERPEFLAEKTAARFRDSASGRTSPVRSLRKVLLPAPLGPRMATLSPVRSCSEKSVRAAVFPRQTVAFPISKNCHETASVGWRGGAVEHRGVRLRKLPVASWPALVNLRTPMAETPPAVEIRNLVKDFKTSFRRKPLRAVDDVSIRIMPGEVYGLIGPNGSGKSTTMKALLGLVAPTSGHCAIFGKDSLKVDSRNEVGFLPENPYFYKHLSGAETLRFYGKLCGLAGRRSNDRVNELLALVDLEDARDRRLGGYSKGMLQRIGLAQALIQEPRLVILDEPTAGVDPVGSRQIRDLILKLRERGITVFLCSHLLEQVQEVCDHVGIIFQGQDDPRRPA